MVREGDARLLTKAQSHDRYRKGGTDEVRNEPDDEFETERDEGVAKDDPPFPELVFVASGTIRKGIGVRRERELTNF
jgi:hypothetical protein